MAWLMNESDWLTLLGEMWSSFDNVGDNYDAMHESPFGNRLHDQCPIVQMMTYAELAVYKELPQTFKIYRGCHGDNKDGFSWSLERQVAKTFPLMEKYQMEGQPLLITAMVKKEKVAAVKLDRGEVEIITYCPKHLHTLRIKQHLAI